MFESVLRGAVSIFATGGTATSLWMVRGVSLLNASSLAVSAYQLTTDDRDIFDVVNLLNIIPIARGAKHLFNTARNADNVGPLGRILNQWGRSNPKAVGRSVGASKLADNLASRNWPAASIGKAISRHAGGNHTTWVTKAGKRIYENPATGRQIVHDIKGGYFRIFQPRTIGSRRGTYLNMIGRELRPARIGKNGVHNPILRDVDKGLWQQETHFFVEELLQHLG